MKISQALGSILCLQLLVVAPVSFAKEGKGKAMKECETKGGKWDKKKKSCQMAKKEEAAPTPAPADAAPATPAPAEESGEPMQ